MPSDIDAYKAKVLEAVEGRKDEFLDVLCRAVRCNTDNPPGDTRSLAAYLEAFLGERGIPTAIYDPVKENPNLVAFVGEPSGRPHLVLNGHLDQFPADDPGLWTDGPYSGTIRDGKIFGRGVSDMKGGTIASLLALLLMHELRVPINGRLTFMGVSDEETGGRWGTGWLLENIPELSGDAVLNGEPYAPDVVGVGERGAFRFVLRVEGEPMHGALSAGDNAICQLSEALLALRPIVREKAHPPADMAGIIEEEKKYTRSPQDVGRQWMLDHPSYNVGVIRGGTKINVVPRFGEAEVDIRIPWGMTPEFIEEKVLDLLKEGCQAARISEVITRNPPSFTPLDERLVRIVRQNGLRVTGREPIYFCGMGGTDCRFFRWRGIPAVVYGPRPVNMGGIDEHIFVEEFLAVIKVHALSIIDYLGLKA